MISMDDIRDLFETSQTKRRRKILATGIAVGAATVAAGGAYLWSRRRKRDRSDTSLPGVSVAKEEEDAKPSRIEQSPPQP